MTTRTRRAGRTAGLTTAGLVALGVVLTGCSAGSGSGSSAASSDAMVGPGFSAGSADGSTSAPPGSNRAVVTTAARIRTGEIMLTSPHLGRVRAQVDRRLAALGGSIDSERTEHSRDGAVAQSTLVVRVPVARFTAAMHAFERIGRMRTSDISSEDVTQQLIDVGQRVTTLENSLERLHRFQRQAADVDQLLRYEQAITARTAELQSLRAQRRYLSDQTAMSTITLTMMLPDKVPPGALHDAGFLPGLRAGWHSLVATVVVALTVVGAALPLTVVLLLVGTPTWLWLRRVLRARRTAPAEPAAP